MFIAALYLAVFVATYVLIVRRFDWGQAKRESLALAALWPLFYLMVSGCGFGVLYDKATDRFFFRNRERPEASAPGPQSGAR